MQGDEVLDLHADAVLDEAGLGEIGGQGLGMAAVAAIDGTDGVQGGGLSDIACGTGWGLEITDVSARGALTFRIC